MSDQLVKAPQKNYFRTSIRVLSFLALILFGFVTRAAAYADYNITICSGASFSFAPPGNPSALTYRWAVPVVAPAGTVNATPQSVPQSSVSQTLINNSTDPSTVTYSVEASDNSTFTLEVTVNPKPVLTNSTATTDICSGNTFNFTAASATAGTTITWNRALVSGITPNTNNGSNNISEALSNATTTRLTATYIIQLQANGCTNTQNISVNVDPRPVLNSSTTPAATCSGSNFVYNPSSNQDPNVTYTWSRATVAGISNSAGTGTGNPNELLTNTTLAPISVNYIYTLNNTATGCTQTQTVTVAVNPLPTLSSSTSNVTICGGTTFNYSPTSALAGTNITWSRASTAGLSPNSGLGNGNISEVLVNNSNINAVTATYEFTLSKSGCVNTQSFDITVNPLPELSSQLFPPGVCSGNTFNYNPTSLQTNIVFAWSRSAVAGISNAAASGSGNPNETLTNTTLLNRNAIYAYTLTNSITTCSKVQNVTVPVYAIPNVTPSPINVNACNNKGFSVDPANVPIGTTYTWSTPTILPTVGALTGGSAQAIGLSYIGQILNNVTAADATATYTVTPNNFGCVGSTFQVVVTVSSAAAPSISLSSSLTPPPICSDAFFNYVPNSISGTPTYAWRRYYTEGISNTLSNGTGNISEQLTNTTTAPVTVNYGVTVFSGGCANTQIVSVQVNPSTQLSSSLTPAAICNNTVFSYTPTSNTASTNSYTWTRAVTSGISNIAASGSNNPNEVLVNTTNAPVSVTYAYTLNTSGNCPTTQNVVVVVNPSPTLSSALSATAICSGANFTYIPTSLVAGASFTWTRNAVNNISNPTQSGIGNATEILVNTGTNAETVSYQYTTYANTCSNTQTVTVVVKPVPVVAGKTAVICSGSSFTTNISSVPAGTQYTWANPTSVPTAVVTGGSAGTLQNSISQTLFNITTDPGILYYTVTPITNGCSGLNFTVGVTVNPIPVATNQTITAICSGTAFNYSPIGIQTGTTYSWGNPVIAPLGTLAGGSAQAAQNSISQTLINNTTTSANAVYTVTPQANGCVGNNFTVTVPVNPVPTVAVQTASICSGGTFNVTPALVPAGTSYTWVAPVNTPFGAVSGAIAQTVPTVSIAQLLVNTTNLPAQTEYTVTPIAGTCAGADFPAIITVAPATQLSSSLTPAAICSNTTFSYNPTSNTPSTNTYNWTRAVVAGISNPTGTGSGNPNETLINTTNAAINVTYQYTLITTAGCSNTQQVIVAVNPTPAMSSSTITTPICGGSMFNYTATSGVAGATLSWTRPGIAGISNPGTSGIGNIAEPLVNTTIAPIIVGYNYTISANGCSSTQVVSITVKPVPVVAAQSATICSNNSFSINPGNVPVGTQYTWTAPVSSPLGATSGSSGVLQNSISQTLSNATLNPALATYTVTPVAAGCTGNDFTVAITVNPVPVATNTTIAAVCSGTAFNYVPAGVPAGTVFSWNNPITSPATSIGGASPQSGQTSISQTLFSTNNVLNNITYTVTPSSYGCSGNPFLLTVPLNPTPVVGNQSVAICSGNSFTLQPSAVPAGTSYTWAIPAVAPVGSVSGHTAQGTPVLSISQVLSNTTNALAQLNYTVIPTAGACVGAPFTIAVDVNPATSLNLSVNPPAICSNNLFSYAAASNTAGTSFNWTRAAVTGISNPAATGINNPNEVLVNITNQPITVSYVYSLATTAGCTNTQTVSVLVNPTPVLTSLNNPAAICSGSGFSYFPTSNVAGANFNWSRAVQTFITNTAASGINNPNEVLVSSAVVPVNVLYTYTISANGCNSQQVVTVPVNPTPNIGNQSTIACSNSSFNFVPANVPTGTVYTWGTPVYNPLGTVTGGSSQASPQSSVSQTLVNTTISTALANYVVTPTAGACTGVPFTLAVTVQPLPVIGNQTLTNVCSGTAFNFAATNVPSGTTYTWSNPLIAPAGILTGGSAQSVAQTAVSQILSSTNNIVNTAVYTVTPASNGCVGTNFTLTVPVNPTPAIPNIFDTVCTGTPITVTPGPVPINTRYTWTTPTVQPFGAIIGATTQASPTANIFQTLVNTTGAPARIAYQVTPMAGTCVGAPFTLAIAVGANLPAIGNQATQVCSGVAFNATPANAPAGTTYTWALPAVNPNGSITGMTNAIFQQASVSEVLNNTTANNATAVYTVVAKNTGCISNSFTATVTVLPVPRVTISGNNVICRYPYDTLSLSFTGGAPWSFTYTDNNGTPQNISGITNAPYKLAVPASAASSRILAFTNVRHGGCLNTTDTSFFTQVINSLPVGTMNTRHGIYICNNIADTLFITSPDSLGYQWKLDGTILPGTDNDSLVTGLPGRYNAILTNKFGCMDTLAQGITLIKINQPILKFAYDTYCIDVLMNLTNLTDTNTTGPINWRWDFGNNNITSGYNSTNTYTVGGNHHIKLTATQLYCPNYPTSMDSTVDIEIPIPGVTMPTVSAYKTVPTPVSVRSIPNYRYQWTPSWGIDFQNSPNVNFNYTNTQQYVVNLISPAGCVTRDSVLVRVYDKQVVDIFMPKSFTPNNDGVNDKLYPFLSGIKEFKYFRIYNRFNQLMFESKNYDDGWNGTLNGTPQPMGIYIWVAVGIANDGSQVQRTGQTLLLR
jgi:gliding motility-associated-like protein